MVWKPSVTVAAVIERDGRFLFVEERIDGRLVLNQPAGHLDEGESLVGTGLEQLQKLGGFHACCFSLQLIHTRVHGIALRRASASGSPQSRQTP